MAGDWTPEENRTIVAVYLEMLDAELKGERYVKADYNREVQAATGRSPKSVDYKFANISAALLRLGHPWIPGYKPMPNIQGALLVETQTQLEGWSHVERVVARLLSQAQHPRPDFMWTDSDPPQVDLRDEWSRRTHGVTPDYVAIDAQNRSLGLAGEQAVVERERRHLRLVGRKDLADRVEHVSQTRGDGLGYDVLSFDSTGEERFIEVKTTRQPREWPMILTENEVRFSRAERGRFRLHRVFDYSERGAGVYELRGPLEETCKVHPISYRAVPA